MNLEQLLTFQKAAELLDVKPSWLKSMVFKKQIPFIKVGKHIRFCPKEIQNWIAERKVQEDSWN